MNEPASIAGLLNVDGRCSDCKKKDFRVFLILIFIFDTTMYTMSVKVDASDLELKGQQPEDVFAIARATAELEGEFSPSQKRVRDGTAENRRYTTSATEPAGAR